MGTPGFAVPTLEGLATQGYHVVGVVTQPDKPAGRGQQVAISPVKSAALARGLPVWQPKGFRRPEAAEHLRALAPEVIVVAAYGHLLPPAVLAIPPLGCLNVHASLLPRYRGAAPISAAILAGDSVSGVTIMRLDAGMDTGDILAQAQLAILPDDTTASLSERLARLGATLLLATLPRWAAGEIVPQPQEHVQATYTHPVHKEDGQINWQRPAVEIARQVRAYFPWPSAHTTWQGRRLKIWRAAARFDKVQGQPGTVIRLHDDLVAVTGEGVLILHELQMEGRRPLPAADFARGQRGFVGTRLGE
jgi:methionyl-tRNA formyltransferase